MLAPRAGFSGAFGSPSRPRAPVLCSSPLGQSPEGQPCGEWRTQQLPTFTCCGSEGPLPFPTRKGRSVCQALGRKLLLVDWLLIPSCCLIPRHPDSVVRLSRADRAGLEGNALGTKWSSFSLPPGDRGQLRTCFAFTLNKRHVVLTHAAPSRECSAMMPVTFIGGDRSQQCSMLFIFGS